MNPTRLVLRVLLTLLCLVLLFPAGAVKAGEDRGSGVPAEALPEDLRGLDIQPRFLPTDFKEAGRLDAVTGPVIVVHRSTREAYYGKPGDTVYENDALITLVDARCRVRFFSNDVVSMGPETRFAVEHAMDRRDKGARKSLFSLFKGKAMFYALRLFRYRERAFEVSSPTAVVGVRGTKFGIRVFPLHENRASAGSVIRVADAGQGLPSHAAAFSDDSAETGAIVACADGYLEVTDPRTGRTLAGLGPNEAFNTATGVKTFEPMNRTLNRIQAETEGDESAEEQAGEETGDATGGGPGDTTWLAAAETAADTVEEETGLDVEEGTGTGFQPPGQWYFAAMLKNLGTGLIEDVYVGGADLGATVSSVPSMIDYPDEFRFNEQTNTVTKVKMAGVWKDADVTWTRTTLGQNAYMAWGYWTSDMAFTGSGPFQFIDKMWWVDGDLNDKRLPKGAITYQGGAEGTYSSPSETIDMKGSFSCKVDFDASSHEVQDFTMNVAGGGKTAGVYNSQVSFDPGFKSEGIGFFMFNDGTWSLNGSTPTDKECQGIVYGEGRGIGGSCGMYNSSTNEGYAGIFHGGRQ